MQARMRSRTSATAVPCPRFSHRRTTILHQRSMGCSPLGGGGVYRQRRRGLTSRKHAARVDRDGTLPRFSCAPSAAWRPQAAAPRLTQASDGGLVRCSTRKSHAAAGAVARVGARGPATSSAVLLGRPGGATTAPGAPSPLASNHGGPWRREASAGRSPTPGGMGQGGAARSRACRPVCSSGLMPGPPGAALAGAGGATAHPAVPGAVHAPGASGVAWHPYAPRGGGQAA
jgi:hypothetical protein